MYFIIEPRFGDTTITTTTVCDVDRFCTFIKFVDQCILDKQDFIYRFITKEEVLLSCLQYDIDIKVVHTFEDGSLGIVCI
jgi:hypothetical protein